MSNVTSNSELTTKEIVEQAIQDYHESILPYLNGQVPVIANKFDKANLYSTDEQIVGRWTDGKPLYQKTIDFGQDKEVKNNSWTSTEVSCANIDKIISNKATNANGDNIVGLIVNKYNGYFGMQCCRSDIGVGSGFGLKYLTLQYTKTTDEAIAIGSDTDYSLEEKIVGTWTDGKPLYQKTFTGNTSISELAWSDTGISFINNGELVSAYNVRWKDPSDNSYQIIPCIVNIISDNNHIQIFNLRNNLYPNGDVQITLQYTKTTDV